MISNKNMTLADDLLKLIVQRRIQKIRFSNTSKNNLIKLSDLIHTAMEGMGYRWDDVSKAMRNDICYIATTDDDINRRVDRIIRDYRAAQLNTDNERGDHVLPSAEDLNPPFNRPEPEPEPESQPEIPNEDQSQDQDQDQDQSEPEDEPDPDGEPDPDQDQGQDQDQSPDQQPDLSQDQDEDEDDDQDQDDDQNEDDDDDPNDTPPEDPNMDLIERIVRHNMAHPDNVINIMLYGPRGTAKTRMGIEVSYKVFGEPPSIMTAPQDKYEIIGYADAHGNPVPTTFIKGYTKPGILLIDEIDRMDQTAGIAMNSAISNGLLDTTYMGVLERDPSMTIIATANTAGTGASSEYVTANVMDSSIRDRFVFIPISWDHEKALSLSDDPALVDFIERWNVACDKAGLGLASASYRALLTWATLSELDLPLTKILDYTVLKGALDPSDLIAVWENLQHRTTVYDTALRCYVDSAKAAMAML